MWFLSSCLYSTVSLTHVSNLCFKRIIYYYFIPFDTACDVSPVQCLFTFNLDKICTRFYSKVHLKVKSSEVSDFNPLYQLIVSQSTATVSRNLSSVSFFCITTRHVQRYSIKTYKNRNCSTDSLSITFHHTAVLADISTEEK